MDWQKVLRDKKVRATPARVEVLAVLGRDEKPVAVGTILVELGKNGIRVDQATVYRIVERLAREGLVKRVDFQEGKFRYELTGEHHHHLICENCGTVEAVYGNHLERVEERIGQQYQFLVKDHSLEFFGLCALCQN